MEEKEIRPVLPVQRTEKAIDFESCLELWDENSARIFFEVVKNRLQHVNDWDKIAGNLFASFQLVNKDGIEVRRSAQQGDYLKIYIPEIRSKTGRGNDWVHIEEMENVTTTEGERFTFRVRPSQNPQRKSQDIARFFSRESPSTFGVTREGTKVSVAINDRITKPNKDADFSTDKLQVAVVGPVDAIIFSKIQWKRIQWKSLTDGLLKR